MIVGEATIVVHMATHGAGAELKSGVESEVAGAGGELEAAGAGAGGRMRKGIEDGLGPASTDAEKAGKDIGEKLTGGMSGSLGKLSGVLGGLGVPTGALAGHFDKAAGSASKLAGGSEGLMGTLSKLGGVSLLGIGVAAVGAGAGLVKLGIGMQETDARLAASAGISMASAKQIGDAFLNTGGDAIVSGQQITGAYSAVAAQLGGVQGSALSSAQAMMVMKSAMDLSEASGQSLESSTKALANVMQSYGLRAKDSATASDQLFQSSRLSGNSLDGVANAITKLHTQLGVMTPPLGQAGALLVDMADHGARGSVAIRTLSTAMTTLLKPTTAVAGAQVDLKNAQDALPPSLQKIAAAYAAGTATAKDVSTATKGLTIDQAGAWKAFVSATGAVDKAKGSLSSMGITVTDQSGKFVGMGSVISQLHTKLQGYTQAQQLAILTHDFGAKAAKTLYATIEAGPAAYDKATAAVDKTGSAHTAAAVQGQTLQHQFEAIKVEAIDVATKFGEKLLPIVVKVGKVFVEGTKFVLDHKAILYGLAVLVGGFLTVTITAFAITTMGKLATSFTDGLSKVGSFAKGLVEKLTAAFATSSVEAEANATVLTTTSAEGQLAFEGLGGGAKAMAVSTEEAAVATDAAIGSTGIGLILIGLGLAITLLLTHWKQVWGFIKIAAQDAWHFIDNNVVRPLEHAWDGVKSAFDAFWGFVKRWGPLVVESIAAPFTFGLSLLVPLIVKHWSAVQNFFTSIPGKVKDAFASAATWLLHAGEDIIKGLWNGAVAGISAYFHFYETIFTKVTTALANAGEWLISSGEHIIEGLLKGLENKVGKITSFFKGIADKVGHELSTGFGLWSPSRKMMGYGDNIMEGWAMGLEAKSDRVLQVVAGVGSGIRAAASGVAIGAPSGATGGAPAIPGLAGGGSHPGSYGGPASTSNSKQVNQNFTFNNVPTSDANSIMREASWSMKTASD